MPLPWPAPSLRIEAGEAPEGQREAWPMAQGTVGPLAGLADLAGLAGLGLAAAALGWLVGVAMQLGQSRLLAPVAGVDPHGPLLLLAACGVALAMRRLRRLGRLGHLGHQGHQGHLGRLGTAARGVGPWSWSWRVPGLVLSWVLCLMLCVVLAGWSFTGWRAAQRVADRLPAALEGVDVQVIGRIDGLPRASAEGLRFTMAVEAAWRVPDALGGATAALTPQALAGLVAPPPPPARSPAGTRTPGGLPVRLPERLSLGWFQWAAAPDTDADADLHSGMHVAPDAHKAKPAAAAGAAPGVPEVAPALRAGDRWQMTVRLKQVHGVLNPHGFDAELWWFAQGVGARGYVRHDAPARRLADDPGAWWPSVAMLRLREHLRQSIAAAVPDAREAGVLAALVVGDQAAIDSADWALFRTTGIAHLVAISGVHVTMFAWLAAAVLGRVWRRLPALAQAWPTPLAARLGGVLLASGYAWLAGWGVPAQRTVLMLLMAAVLRTGQARWPWPLVLLAAGVVVTTLDPWALLQPGFWLSFAAVGLLMASEPAQGGPVGASNDPQAQARGSRAAVRVAGLRALLAEHGRAQWVATLGLAPLGLVFFQQVSVVGLLANLVAIPWVTLVVTPLALLGTLAPALWAVAAWGVGVLVACLQGLADGAWAVWRVPVAPDWALWPAALGTVLGVLPLPWRLRALALPLVVPLLWPWPVRPADGQFELLAVDVGQGTAVLVRTRHHLLVYDAGPGYHAGGDAGDRILTPLLRARGEARIDTLVVSHRDTDHAGGAHSLLATWPVEQLLSGLPTHHRLHAEAAHWRFCHEGQRWQWDGVDFEVLHPPAPASPEVAPALLAPSSNAASCVLRVVDAHGRVALLTGDIEAAQEHRLVHERPEAVRADIVLVPHHGSRTSSTPGFVMAVSARWAVVQAGYRSRYGHPAADVEARWQRWGAEVVRTDRCGAWRWHNKRVSCLRQAHQRHWRQ